jgi:ElaB/YqjD/DUF883 family membrane-anchored ribosome-binding protein
MSDDSTQRLERLIEVLTKQVGEMAQKVAAIDATLKTRAEQEPSAIVELRTQLQANQKESSARFEAAQKESAELRIAVDQFKEIANQIRGGYKLVGWLASVGPFVGALIGWLATRN